MSNQGWICLYRQLLEDPIWANTTSKQHSILIAIMLLANHSANKWDWQGKKFEVKAGQFVASLPSLAKKSGKDVSIQNVRTALKHFEKLEFLTDKSTEYGRLITVVNWAKYQDKPSEPNRETNRGLTDHQQTSNRPLTANNNDNNVNNDNNIFYSEKMTDVINPTPTQFTTPEAAGVKPTEEMTQKRQFFTLHIWSKYPETRRGDFEEAFTQFLSALEEDKAKVIATGIKNYVEAKEHEPIKYTAMLANNLKRRDYRNDYSTKKHGRQEQIPSWAQDNYQVKTMSADEEEKLRKQNEELMKQLGVK